MDDLLEQGIVAFKAGKRNEARKLFIAAVKQSPDNVHAWGGMYEVSIDDKERVYCLKQMLRINTGSKKASELLNQLLAPSLDSMSPLPIEVNSPQQQPVAIQEPKIQPRKKVDNVNALRMYANHFIKAGWTISSMTDRQFIATRRKEVNSLVSVIGILGLCLYVIPGLLILLLGYMARGTETRIITDTEAQAWLTQEEQQAQKLQAEKEARKVANDKKIVELSGSPLRFWYKMSSNQRATLAVVIVGLLIVFACVLNAFMGQTFSPSPQPQSDLAALPKHTVNDYQDNGKGTNLVYVIVADKSLTEEDAKKIITYYENKHPGYIIMNIWIFCDSTYAAVKYVNGVIYSDDPYLSHVMYWLMASKLGTEKRWFHSGPDTDFPAFRSACK